MPHSPSLQPLTATFLLSGSMNLTTLDRASVGLKKKKKDAKRSTF